MKTGGLNNPFRVLTVAGLLAVLAGALLISESHPRVLAGPTPSPTNQALVVPYTGTDYYGPASTFTRCPRWTWLQADCYRNRQAEQDVPAQLASDLRFTTRSHLGRFQRVWISLDELMRWNEQTGFEGYSWLALANVDDMLRHFAASDIKVDLVLFHYTEASGERHLFHPEALDGVHAMMRYDYLEAVRQFVTHLAGRPIDRSTVAVVDLENEPYDSLEQYFDKGSLDLGKYSQCWTGQAVDADCVDQNIIHPWLMDVYQTAKSAAPNFSYTFSDTGRLLQTDSQQQHYWVGMYPVDVYDIHMYSDGPAEEAARWASGRALPKPWFAGEAGCAVGHQTCTYDGSTSLAVDTWWLSNLSNDGARAVLIEDRTTAWTYRDGPNSQTLTPTGREIRRMTLATMRQASTHAR